MEQKFIKEGQAVLSNYSGGFKIRSDGKSIVIIQNVGNSRKKGDRGESTVSQEELSYDLYNPVTKETHTGVCGHSTVTTEAEVLSGEDLELYVLRELSETNISIISLREKNNNLKKHFEKILSNGVAV